LVSPNKDGSEFIAELTSAFPDDLVGSIFTTKKLWAPDYFYAYSQSKNGNAKLIDAPPRYIARYIIENLLVYLNEILDYTKADARKFVIACLNQREFEGYFDERFCEACGLDFEPKNIVSLLYPEWCDHNLFNEICCHCYRNVQHHKFYIYGVKQRIRDDAEVDPFLSRKRVWIETGPFCYLCGIETYFNYQMKPDRMRWNKSKHQMAHMDHIIPLAKGGTHTLNNVSVTCSDCNMSKGDR
jgi:hypothetical protein